jgi:hypothetical protein
VSKSNFERVWIRTKKGRKKMAIKWKSLLSKSHPDLSNLADLWDSVQTDQDKDQQKKGKKRKKDKKASSASNDSEERFPVEGEGNERKRKRCNCN